MRHATYNLLRLWTCLNPLFFEQVVEQLKPLRIQSHPVQIIRHLFNLALPASVLLARDSGRKHKAWGGARLCERNPSITNKILSEPALAGISIKPGVEPGFASATPASPIKYCLSPR